MGKYIAKEKSETFAVRIVKLYKFLTETKKENILQTTFDFSNHQDNEIIDELKKIDPLNITAIEALNKLYEICEKIKKENK